ncbi:MAG: quinate 5-dehydrogenase [Chloroflexi bacterium]|nr:quinate 5-dehydrogenase [Chloroflexota bacterium]
MKRVVSVSLGSSSRDHKAVVELLGQQITIERIGTDGDEVKARQLYRELDGQVDAFGVGGIDLILRVRDRRYRLHQAYKLVQDVRRTPVVDGGGLKNTLERRVMKSVEAEIGDQIQPKRVLITSAADRFGMALSFDEAGYEAIYGDLMFGLGLPIPVRGIANLERVARVLLPVIGWLPLSLIYPTGQKQREIVPKYGQYYDWASVVAGDFLYIKRHLPQSLAGKTVVTNTTTPQDVDLLRGRGVRYLATTTPRLQGRSFGTNVMEATLVALAGKGRPLEEPEIEEMLAHLGFQTSVQRLNEATTAA